MTQKLLALACLTVFAVAACKPEPAEPAAEVPTATEVAPASALDPPTEGLSSDARGFDTKAFAGTFSGTLPCASCPGIDTTLALNADGTYEINEIYQEQDAPAAEMDGTWTVEDNDRQIRLDPNSKAEQDRLYVIDSNGQITQLGLDGTPAASGLDYSLKRNQ